MSSSILKVEFYLTLFNLSSRLKQKVSVSYYEKAIKEIQNDKFLFEQYGKYIPEFEYKIAEKVCQNGAE
jgi:hypothetical protein